MILDLLPTGLAWAKDPGFETYEVATALSKELERIDTRASDLLRESDPRTTSELIGDWERVLGLPDECSGDTPTLQDRRDQVVARLTDGGSINRQYYIDLAASLGFTVTIFEYRPFLAGRGRAGDAISNGLWIFVWQINAPENTIKYFRAGSSLAGEALARWGNDTLECLITKRAPAGTKVLFSYGG